MDSPSIHTIKPHQRPNSRRMGKSHSFSERMENPSCGGYVQGSTTPPYTVCILHSMYAVVCRDQAFPGSQISNRGETRHGNPGDGVSEGYNAGAQRPPFNRPNMWQSEWIWVCACVFVRVFVFVCVYCDMCVLACRLAVPACLTTCWLTLPAGFPPLTSPSSHNLTLISHRRTDTDPATTPVVNENN